MGTDKLTPEVFVEFYGNDAPVRFPNGQEMTLGAALQFEALFCPADDEQRKDPTKRLTYMAGMLAAGGSLRSEHAHLLPDTKE